MRSKIKVEGKWYRPVPWLKDASCDGCALDGVDGAGCINTTKYGQPCDDGKEFTGMVLIPNTKEAYESYIHKAVLQRMDNAE